MHIPCIFDNIGLIWAASTNSDIIFHTKSKGTDANWSSLKRAKHNNCNLAERPAVTAHYVYVY